ALHAGADVIDLKDPNIGALGALDLETTAQILKVLDGRATVSATVGEHHVSQQSLFHEIEARAGLGLDIVKIAVDKHFDEADFFDNIAAYTAGVKLVALFFADVTINTQLLAKLNQVGFYGAMLDTQNKQRTLLELLTEDTLKMFINECRKNQLFCGLAGSLKPQYIESLQDLQPTFIGFRGGVCENNIRKSVLNAEKILQIKIMLLKHNKISNLAQKRWDFALHTI
ncbi:MAG: (5-formylfuran-3-yl)methyl phosphate synthase, partial [Methylophilaceae bacterium]